MTTSIGSVGVVCGGVGAARFLRALASVHPAERTIGVVNTGDDTVLHGLNISPGRVEGRLDAEIAPMELPGKKGKTVPFAKDEHNRPETSAESLAKLKPAFRKEGSITAGNAPGLNSAGAAMVVALQSRRIDLARRSRFGRSSSCPRCAHGARGVVLPIFG